MSGGRRLRAVKLALALGLVVYVAAALPPGVLWAHLAGIAPGWFVLAFTLYLASHLLGACVLHFLLRPQAMALSPIRLFGINLAAHFYALFMPAGTLAGGVVRWYRLGYAARRMPEVLSALMTSRALEIVALVALALVGWLLDPLPVGGAAVGAVLGALLAGSAGLYVALSSRPLALRLVAVVRLVSAGAALRRLALRFLAAVRNQGRLVASDHARLLALGLLRQVVGGAAIYALAVGLDLDLTLAAVIWARSLVAILTMLPISFAGLGVREAGFVLLLQPYGIAPAAALALSLSAFALAVLMALIGGVGELRRLIARPAAPDQHGTARDLLKSRP
jgi:uncharacterized membrane protein YbhN (UPF0104 family)